MGGFVKFLDRGSAPYGCVINQPQASWLKAATYVCRISRGVTGLFCFMWWQLGALGWPEGSEMASPAWLAAGWEFSWDCWPGRGGGSVHLHVGSPWGWSLSQKSGCCRAFEGLGPKVSETLLLRGPVGEIQP